MHTRKTSFFSLEDGRKVTIPAGLRVVRATNPPANSRIKWWLEELPPKLQQIESVRAHFETIGFGLCDEDVMQMPIVNLNGSSAESLAREYSGARIAIEEAIRAVPCPHGRDYQTKEDTYSLAREQHEKLIQSLRNAADELVAIEEFLSKQ